MNNKRRKKGLPTLQGSATTPNRTATRYKKSPNATPQPRPPQELVSPPDSDILERPCTIRQALNRMKKADPSMYNLILGRKN